MGKEKARVGGLYKVEGKRVVRLRPYCPRCGAGVFMAEHQDRYSCGKCGFTKFKGGE